MERYWNNRPRHNQPPPSSSFSPPAGSILFDFERHRQRLVKEADTCEEEGWEPELRNYLKVVSRDVSPETDLVEWWQVSFRNLLYKNGRLIMN
jgi:hypothetical protein